MHRQADVGLLGHWDDRFQEALVARPQISRAVPADVVEYRQVPAAIVVVGGQARSATAGLFVIAAHRAERIPVVFDDRNADSTGDANRLLHLLDVLVGAGTAEDGVAEVVQHHVAELEAGFFDRVLHLAKVGLLPRRRRIVRTRLHHAAFGRVGRRRRSACGDVLDAEICDEGQRLLGELTDGHRDLDTASERLRGRRDFARQPQMRRREQRRGASEDVATGKGRPHAG